MDRGGTASPRRELALRLLRTGGLGLKTRMRLRARVAIWSLAVSVAGCLASLACWSTAASAASPLSATGVYVPSFASPLVTPGSPAQSEQLQTEREAKLSSPEAVAEREASASKYENLDAEKAATVADEAFPSLVSERGAGHRSCRWGEASRAIRRTMLRRLRSQKASMV
jgi:hypothetical protein